MKVLVLSSGGIDSSTCLGLAVKEYGKENVVALSIFYGQKHDKELKASDAVANYYGVEHIKLNLSSIFDYSDCSLLSHSNQEIAHESYAEQIKKTDGKQHMFLLEMVYLFLLLLVLHFQRVAVKFYMVLIVMMLPVMLIQIVVRYLMML